MADRTLRSYLEESAPELVELLVPIRQAVVELWDRPQHQEFTDHGLDHSERVIAKLDALSHDMMGTGKKLCPREAFYALAAAYLHDVGMQMGRPEQSGVLTDELGEAALSSMGEHEYKRVVREHHALLSAEMIIAGAKAPTEHYDLRVPRQDAAYLASIVKGHGLDDLNGEEFSDMYVGDDVIRLQLLAAMLRLADELDVDRRRVNIDLLKVQEIETLSKLHWWKHHYVEGAHIEQGTILLHFRLPSPKYAEPVVKYVIERIEREERELRDILWVNDVKLRLKSPKVSYDSLREEMPLKVWDLLVREVGGPPPEEKRPATVEDYLERLSDDDDVRYASLALPGMQKRIDLESLYVPLAVMERMELERLQEETRTKTFERMRHLGRAGEAEPVDMDQALSTHRRIVVLGHPGAGKTTLLKHLVITFARGRRAERWAPIYISLASIPARQS